MQWPSQGVGCLPRGYVSLGVCVCQGGGVCPEGVCLGCTPPVNRITDKSKNITFPQLLLRSVMKNTLRLHFRFVYLQSDHITDIKCSNLYVNSRPTLVTLDYEMDMSIVTSQQNGDVSTKNLKIDPRNRYEGTNAVTYDFLMVPHIFVKMKKIEDKIPSNFVSSQLVSLFYW